MTVQARPNSLQTYQVVLYKCALHPELFDLKDRRVLSHGAYEVECWVMPACHLLRFELGGSCVSELVTDQEDAPKAGVVEAFLCAGERDFEHQFERERINYMTTVQTEQLPENLYAATLDELVDHAREVGAMQHRWNDGAGDCLSILDIQTFSREVHVQAYHMLARGGVVLRTQTIFEHQ